MGDYKNLVDLLENRSTLQPDQIAYTFLAGGEQPVLNLTYQELAQKARVIAAEIQAITSLGDRALLVYPYNAGSEFIPALFACFYAGVVAVPCSAPRRSQELNKIIQRFQSSQATVVLSTTEVLNSFKTQLQSQSDLTQLLSQIKWLASDSVPLVGENTWRRPNIEEETLAYLQYTSGSTGEPKGVMITYANVLQNCRTINQGFRETPASIMLSWLPLFHDMGLVGGVFQPIYVGFRSIISSPISLIQKPLRWLEWISEYKITLSGGPNFAYDLLCSKVTPEQRENLDLSSWAVAFSGAEPVRAETLEKFAAMFAPCGFRQEAFYPCYGMAETTLFVSGGKREAPPVIKYLDGKALEQDLVVEVERTHPHAKSIVGCGRTWLKDKVIIVNPETLQQCPEERIGEIWVQGSGVGKGYWQKPQATQATFQAHLADNPQAGKFLRTGDLGFVSQGEIFITGRLKELIIIWGLNRYPQHLEVTAQASHPALRLNCGAAFGIEVEGEEKLVIAQEIERTYLRNLPTEEVINAIREAIALEHTLEVYAIALLKPGALPKTSSGKVQRRLCKQMYLTGQLKAVTQWQQEQAEQHDITDLMNQAE
ncbi:MAG: fatty acyl-AMP ligase [Cyanobacteria bacterium J083]|nr:MAG: fatty acyl-AMP ligase [Cyanobacteria bacterium J083]